MSTETNKKLLVQSYLAMDAGDAAKVQSLYSADAKFTIAGAPGTMDFNGFMQFFSAFMTAFSQPRHVIKSQVAEGDRVSTYLEWHAVHTGPFHGIPASHKPVKIQAITHHTISSGKITEQTSVFDAMSLMQQIGAMQAAA
jgi:steroid delta-isomerase-like uncharacterized protein